MKVYYTTNPDLFLSYTDVDVPINKVDNFTYQFGGKVVFLNENQSIEYIEVSDTDRAIIEKTLNLNGNFEDCFEIVSGKITKKFNVHIEELKEKRNKLLEQSDFLSGTMYADIWAALDDDLRKQWTDYRQTLRNVTLEVGSIEEIENYQWPEVPTPALTYINNKKIEELKTALAEREEARIKSEEAFLANLESNSDVTP